MDANVRKTNHALAHLMRIVACLLMLLAGAAAQRGNLSGSWTFDLGTFDLRHSMALVVLLAAAIVPIFSRSRSWRKVQLALDVAVLGFWNGLFLSTARMVGWAGAGLPGMLPDLAAALLMLAMAFLYPVFGRQSHYCLHVCPFGAAQELAGLVQVSKWRPSPSLVRHLTMLRRLLWAALMLLLWCGFFARWMEWELFSAFAWQAVPPLVTILAIVFVVLSAFVPRAYCRFICPTGTLFKLSEANQPAT